MHSSFRIWEFIPDKRVCDVFTSVFLSVIHGHEKLISVHSIQKRKIGTYSYVLFGSPWLLFIVLFVTSSLAAALYWCPVGCWGSTTWEDLKSWKTCFYLACLLYSVTGSRGIVLLQCNLVLSTRHIDWLIDMCIIFINVSNSCLIACQYTTDGVTKISFSDTVVNWWRNQTKRDRWVTAGQSNLLVWIGVVKSI
jgi:hypothetical protein